MSIFTKRHYVWLASVGRDMTKEASCSTVYAGCLSELMIRKLADALEEENDSFDKPRFLKAVYGPFIES